MSILKKASFILTNSEELTDAVMIFMKHMKQVDRTGKLKVTIEVMEDIARYKKRYFAMVTELAKHAGYSSHKDRDQFKEQIRAHIGIRSMTDIETAEEAMLAIEAIHQVAAEHYKYIFKQDGELFTGFNSPKGGEQ